MGTFDICTNGDNQVLKKLLDSLHTFKNENDVQVQQASTWTRIYTFDVNDELYSSLCLWTKFVSLIRFANWMSNLITLTISEDGSDSFFKTRREAFDLLDSVYALVVFFKKVVEPVFPLANGQEDDIIAQLCWKRYIKWYTMDQNLRPSKLFDQEMLKNLVELL